MKKVSTAPIDIEKITHNHKDDIEKIFEIIEILANFSEVAIKKSKEEFDRFDVKLDSTLKDVQDDTSRQVTKLEKTSTDISM